MPLSKCAVLSHDKMPQMLHVLRERAIQHADCRGGTQSWFECSSHDHKQSLRRHFWETINHPRNHRPSVTTSDVSCNYIYLLLHCSNDVSGVSAFFWHHSDQENFVLCRTLIPYNWCRCSQFYLYIQEFWKHFYNIIKNNLLVLSWKHSLTAGGGLCLSGRFSVGWSILTILRSYEARWLWLTLNNLFSLILFSGTLRPCAVDRFSHVAPLILWISAPLSERPESSSLSPSGCPYASTWVAGGATLEDAAVKTNQSFVFGRPGGNMKQH